MVLFGSFGVVWGPFVSCRVLMGMGSGRHLNVEGRVAVVVES